MKIRQQGFTLTELMIIVAIISILVLIAYPSYNRYTRHARLSDARATLLQNAQNLERFYKQKGTFRGYSKFEHNEYFDVSASRLDDAGYIIQAKPNSQNAGESCTVSLNDGGLFSAQSSSNQSCPGFD